MADVLMRNAEQEERELQRVLDWSRQEFDALNPPRSASPEVVDVDQSVDQAQRVDEVMSSVLAVIPDVEADHLKKLVNE